MCGGEGGEWGAAPGLCAALQRPLLSLLEFNSNDRAGLCVCMCVVACKDICTTM